jgi:glycosyltransferase involved in cell wall biosynthesis
MSTPRVSIGLPVFNGENYLAEAARSLLEQDFTDFELIISDNGSNDGTEDICRRLVEVDSRVRYLRSDSNRGAAWNYNRVFSQARGEFFKWQAHDDLCLPAFLSSCLRVFDAGPPSVVLVCPRTSVVDAAGAVMPQHVAESFDIRDPNPHRRLAQVLRRLNMACPVFGLIRASALQRTRLIGPFIASDYVLLSELAMLGELREVPQTLFLRRIHPRISTYASRSASELQSWFDPSRRRRATAVSPMLALGGEFLRSAFTVPCGPLDKALCGGTAASVWYARELRNLAGRYKARMLGAMASAPKG